MAILTFSPIPADLVYLEPNYLLEAFFRIDGARSSSATLIEAQTTYIHETLSRPPDHYGATIDLDIEGLFSYGPLGTVGGTVTSITLSTEGTEIASLTEVDGDASAIWAAMLGSHVPLIAILAGNDTITGTEDIGGVDLLRGYGGDDLIDGLNGSNRIYGGRGNDRILGGDDLDIVYAGADDDRVHGRGGRDSLHGGAGNDLLRGNQGPDDLDGDAGNDHLRGGLGDDGLYGAAGNDRLFGGRGDDRIITGFGNNAVWGGPGNDTISAESGNDTLSGGADADRFMFSMFGNTGDTGHDIITDFETIDQIVLGYMKKTSAVSVTQVGDDVVIAMADAPTADTVTVLDASLDEVKPAIITTPYDVLL